MSNIFKTNSRFAILSEDTNDDKKKNEKKKTFTMTKFEDCVDVRV
jgi:hypothetical protein